MAYGGGVNTVVAEAATIRVAPVFFSSDLAQHHFKVCPLRPKIKAFRQKIENVFVRKYCLCPSRRTSKSYILWSVFHTYYLTFF